ncbi:SDR family NAD(P)-dependent oxidoreductase [Amycolatopsis viridis]|uniref:NAD(P)-dependent dehydrogenase (Short-subunit alcohol dehydrogenase family) n=1 Tax=Amycolatopsis viridis TaxID=185678 RepID=A0ABX0SW21_9PSEU|nr:SDR family NAD(P)-dependent oxidoreductase [Amycolatopsis viridis]NIH80728.1 NAD(P)-dependent dehydrogenase (short-subunit alcohol dehydrogenase family) [Amycolatopsis viridis]
MTLEGKVALVTGAAGGVGVAICRALREAGARVALTDVDGSALDEVASGLGDGAATFVTDLADDDAAAALPARVRDEFGSLDILVNNAGVRQVAPMLDLTPAQWRRTLDVDLVAPFVLCRAAIPLMAEQGRGKIVNIASMAGLAAFRDRAAYSAAKAGLIMLTKNITVEFGDRGIWCNAVAPGVVETPMTSFFFASPGMTSSIRANTPMRRWSRPEEIARPVVFLSGPESDFVNGTVVPVDGGWTAGYYGAELSPRPEEA